MASLGMVGGALNQFLRAVYRSFVLPQSWVFLLLKYYIHYVSLTNALACVRAFPTSTIQSVRASASDIMDV